MVSTATRNSETFTLTTPSEREFVITRLFDAPRELVWQAWTQPEHVRNWWGCDESKVTVCEIDLRVGGTWRNVMQLSDGQEFGFHGEYREIAPVERLVHTFIYEPMPQHPSLVTAVFEEQGGKTLMTETTRHETIEARDGQLNSGMEGGTRQSLDRLEELLATQMEN